MTKARPDKQTYALSLTDQQSLAGLVAAIEAEFNTHLFDELPPEQNFRKSMMRRALQNNWVRLAIPSMLAISYETLLGQ